MSATQFASLSDRGVISVTGLDAEKLLQGLITNDLDQMVPGEAKHAGLLSPQGKIISDFFVVRVDDGFLLDVASASAPDLVKRLSLYRLRSKVDIADRSTDFIVGAAWGEDPKARDGAIAYLDPRLPAMGVRMLANANETANQASTQANEAAYHRHRVALGVPEGGRDYAFGDTFPHEALFDQLNGVSFSKGCYVGQEIVSRMQHRGTARKRIVQVTGQSALPPTGTDIAAGDVVIGQMGSITDTIGLALVRLDRAAEFKTKNVALAAGGVGITLQKPAFATFAMEPASSGTALQSS